MIWAHLHNMISTGLEVEQFWIKFVLTPCLIFSAKRSLTSKIRQIQVRLAAPQTRRAAMHISQANLDPFSSVKPYQAFVLLPSIEKIWLIHVHVWFPNPDCKSSVFPRAMQSSHNNFFSLSYEHPQQFRLEYYENMICESSRLRRTVYNAYPYVKAGG